MFLRTLNNQQKRLFLSLANAAAAANNVVEESEKVLLAAYADEMGIDPDDTNNNANDVEEIFKGLKEISTSKELNQITFEIVGMMISDSEYDDSEKAFIEKMAAVFEIPHERVDKMFQYVNDYSTLIKKINILMFE